MTKSILLLAALAVALVLTGAACLRKAPTEPPTKPEVTQPVSNPEIVAKIDRLIAQLGDDDIEKREAAEVELIKIGKPALALVEKALNETDDPEVRNRATTIAEEIGKTIFTLIGKNAQGYEEYKHELTGMIFVRVPGGTFKMGNENGDNDEKPVHEVKLDGFMISKYEVTQAVWKKIMGNNPSQFKGDDNPVDHMSWNTCQEFSKKTGLRLPTEAEWEYACRSGTGTKFYWGDEPDSDYMWYALNSDGKTHPAGEKRPNGFGLCDISGNVWEWCQDWYGEEYYANSPHDNPTGPDSGKFRVMRGGGWWHPDKFCRSACRMIVPPDFRGDYHCGFRVVADVPR